jgi:glycosyltransferase involved in cell wall biosynthesis
MTTISKPQTFVTRSGNEVVFEASTDSMNKVLNYQKEMGNEFPKFAVFLISYNASNFIERTIERIPLELQGAIEELFVFDDSSPDNTYEVAKGIRENSPWKEQLFIYKNPKNLGYGGNQKVGYRYGIDKGFDYIIMLHADGQYAPEYIPDLMLAALEGKHQVVFGSRMINRKHALEGGMPLYKWVGNQILTRFENLILGTSLHEFHSGYRMYSTKVLKAIPFEENTNEFHFDSQIIVQCRALGAHMHEIPIKTYYGDEECNVDGMKYAKDVCLTVLEYRLHQLHLTRRSRYLVDREFVYTRKNSPYSSHEKILSKIDKPGKALDLGSSNGLLSQAMKDKGVSCVCVDMVEPEKISKEIEEYHQVNLENYQQLKFEREFDYIILADVVEHIRNAPGLMTHIQKFLKEDGKIIVSVPNIAIWIYRLSLLIGRFNYGPKGTLDETHVRFYTRPTFIQLLERAGYKIKDMDYTGLPFEVVFESVGKSRILRFVDAFYFALVKFWPKMFSYQFVAVAEMTKYNAKDGEGLIK